MKRLHQLLLAPLAVALVALPAVSQPPKSTPPISPTPAPMPRPKGPLTPLARPRLTPVAETKLLMEGLNQPNFQALEKTLKSDKIDGDSWAFARGQALLIGETGNLLMMRPPNNSGQDTWLKAATELRDNAAQLAKIVATRDVAESRLGLTRLANTCNNCHQTFKVQTKVTAFEDAKP